MEAESIIIDNNQTCHNQSTPLESIMTPLKVEPNIHKIDRCFTT